MIPNVSNFSPIDTAKHSTEPEHSTPFEAGRSIHHHTIQINQPTRCNSFTSLLLDVLCRSTCFGRLHAHHQEVTTALTASGFTYCHKSSFVTVGKTRGY